MPLDQFMRYPCLPCILCPHLPYPLHPPLPVSCLSGCIQVSETTRELLTSHTFTPTGGVEVKGKVREGCCSGAQGLGSSGAQGIWQ